MIPFAIFLLVHFFSEAKPLVLWGGCGCVAQNEGALLNSKIGMMKIVFSTI